jgi:hypothetical protein
MCLNECTWHKFVKHNCRSGFFKEESQEGKGGHQKELVKGFNEKRFKSCKDAVKVLWNNCTKTRWFVLVFSAKVMMSSLQFAEQSLFVVLSFVHSSRS